MLKLRSAGIGKTCSHPENKEAVSVELADRNDLISCRETLAVNCFNAVNRRI
jgi:hypothetical protein